MIIYKITNNINGKVYIGQTIRTLDERIREHKRFKKSLISKAFRKYGFKNFIFEIIDNADSIEELNDKECKWIKLYNCIVPLGYNQCEGGGNTLGFHHREDSKSKMSVNKANKKTGKDNSFYGKTHSNEQKAKWSEQRRGRTLSEEWIEKLRKSHFKKVINLDTGEIFESIKEAAKKYNTDSTHITKVCKGKGITTCGCRWQYYNEYMAIPCQASNEEDVTTRE